MKILNIFGFVVAVHIAVLVIAFAVPGCSTTDRNAPTVSAGASAMGGDTSPVSSPISASNRLNDADLNPALAGPAPAFDPNARATGVGVAGGVRASPTRPGSTNLPLVPQAIPLAAPMPPPAATYTVVRGDSLWSIAKRNNITVRELAQANDLSTGAMLQLGQVLLIPGSVAAPAATFAAEDEVPAGTSYTILPGDTLAKIARRHNLTVAALKAYNNLTSDMVRAGDTLTLPESATIASATTTGSGSTATASGAATSTPAATPASGMRHTVSSGESLTVIARRYGVKIGDLAVANNIRDPSLIRQGQVLIIPGVAAQPTTPVPATNRPAARPSNVPAADQDLDSGLPDADAVEIPILDVEEDEEDEEVPTLSFGIPVNDAPGQPPRFE